VALQVASPLLDREPHLQDRENFRVDLRQSFLAEPVAAFFRVFVVKILLRQIFQRQCDRLIKMMHLADSAHEPAQTYEENSLVFNLPKIVNAKSRQFYLKAKAAILAID
jgi:hypothetical protein